jgi:hypothetical protein
MENIRVRVTKSIRKPGGEVFVPAGAEGVRGLRLSGGYVVTIDAPGTEYHGATYVWNDTDIEPIEADR